MKRVFYFVFLILLFFSFFLGIQEWHGLRFFILFIFCFISLILGVYIVFSWGLKLKGSHFSIHYIENIRSQELSFAQIMYSAFPYPNRPVWIKPNVLGSLKSHAGFVDCQQKKKGLSMENLKNSFPSSSKILLAGCGTDEPLLFRLLHPENPITCIDLSPTSLKKASQRLTLFSDKKSWSKTDLWCGDIISVLNRYPEKYQFIQCYGVLMIQDNPYDLFKKLVEHLSPGGLLRLMVYTHKGRSIERWVQRRYHQKWRKEKNKYRFVKKSVWKLWVWQLGGWFLKPSLKYRFKYIGFSFSALADSFLHPCDLGLPPSVLNEWCQKLNMDIVYCLAKDKKNEPIEGNSENCFKAWEDILTHEKKGELNSNITLILKKK